MDLLGLELLHFLQHTLLLLLFPREGLFATLYTGDALFQAFLTLESALLLSLYLLETFSYILLCCRADLKTLLPGFEKNLALLFLCLRDDPPDLLFGTPPSLPHQNVAQKVTRSYSYP
jgi:hypothetical protein